MSMNENKRNRSVMTGGKALLVGAAVLFLIGAVVGFVDGDDQRLTGSIARGNPWVVLTVAGVVAVVSFIFSLRWMQGLDELAQRAHYEAWYWGGSLGLMAVVFAIVAAPALEQVVDLERMFAPLAIYSGESAGFVSGAMATVIVMGIGYGLWWVFFWLRKR